MPQTAQNEYPLRVDRVLAAAYTEWRTDDILPESRSDAWQLVYVRSGAVEELCADRRVLLRQGGILLHQPQETHAMRVVGDLPPEVLRIEFTCAGPAMDRFRGRVFHAEPAELTVLNLMGTTITRVFFPPEHPGDPPAPRPEPAFGAAQELVIYLEHILIYLGRRVARSRRPSARLRRDRSNALLVESARMYFSRNLTREVKLEEVCAACGCTRRHLQQAFRAKAKHGPMEDFAAMRLEYAAQLLGRGASPGEVAQQLGYCSGAYFSQRFRAATGQTPSEYRRQQLGLPARRPSVKQKDKADSKTSIPETTVKK